MELVENCSRILGRMASPLHFFSSVAQMLAGRTGQEQNGSRLAGFSELRLT
jgi:hypothetical protein